MSSSYLLSIVTFIYGLSAAVYIFAWVFNKPASGKAATWISAAGAGGNLVGILLRWAESYHLKYGHAPLSNQYESLVFFALVIVITHLVVELKFKTPNIGAFTIPIAFLTMAFASLYPGMGVEIRPLIPALKSNWLIAHVITCFIGYGSFAVSFGVSIMYLMKKGQPNQTNGLLSRLPASSILDELNNQLVMFGFLFLSIGIITGAVWANSAWGRYWGWDPKETWSLITWFIYASLLHFRFLRGWQGTRIAVFSMIGFAAVLFTYFGVNLLPGLHSYGAMGAN